MSFVYWTRSCLWSSDSACGTNREVTFILPKSSTKIWWVVSLLTPNSSAIILTVTQHSSCIHLVTFAMSPSLRIENGRPGLASSSIVSTPLLNSAYHLNICARDKQLSPYTCLINSTIPAAVFPSLKQNLMFALCSMPLLWPRRLTTPGAVFPVMLSLGRCGVTRLQMKVSHMDINYQCFV